MQKVNFSVAEKNNFPTAHIPNKTAFKAVVYYHRKPDGVFYTVQEKADKKNRKYHDSYDYIATKEKLLVTRHDLAYNKLSNYIAKKIDNIQTCLLFANIQGQEYCILKIINGKVQAAVEPIFTTGKNNFDIVLRSLRSNPISLSYSNLK